ncbi:hypothetical protein H5410_036500, partial [Solanum commersonii]
MRSSRIPTCRMNTSLRLNPLTISSCRPKTKSLEMKPSFSSSLQNPQKIYAAMDRSASLVEIADQLSDSPFGVVRLRLALSFSIVVLWFIGLHGTSSQIYSAIRRLLPISADLILFFRAQHTGTKANKLKFNRSERVSRTMLHKPKFTYAKIKCVLKDSSCDSPISTNLMLTILSSNASSSSTIFKALESDATLTLTKKNIIHNFTHRFSHIFQSTFVSAHSRSKRSLQG